MQGREEGVLLQGREEGLGEGLCRREEGDCGQHLQLCLSFIFYPFNMKIYIHNFIFVASFCRDPEKKVKKKRSLGSFY